jgi:hypothetical protein
MLPALPQSQGRAKTKRWRWLMHTCHIRCRHCNAWHQHIAELLRPVPAGASAGQPGAGAARLFWFTHLRTQ